MFGRLRHLQVAEGLTWSQVAQKLGVGVSMLMMVKSGERGLGPRTLYRLEQVEREIADRKSRAERIVDQLLAGEGTAANLVKRELRSPTGVSCPVDYLTLRKARALPRKVVLTKPPEEHCTRLRQFFSETVDVTTIVLACLPQKLRSEKYLARLTPDARIRLNKASLNLVIPNWRTLAAGDEKPPS